MHSSAGRLTQLLSPRIMGIGAAMITALVPGLSAMAAAALLNEPLYWNLLAGLALVTLGIMFGVRKGLPIAIKKEATYASATVARGLFDGYF